MTFSSMGIFYWLGIGGSWLETRGLEHVDIEVLIGRRIYLHSNASFGGYCLSEIARFLGSIGPHAVDYSSLFSFSIGNCGKYMRIPSLWLVPDDASAYSPLPFVGIGYGLIDFWGSGGADWSSDALLVAGDGSRGREQLYPDQKCAFGRPPARVKSPAAGGVGLVEQK